MFVLLSTIVNIFFGLYFLGFLKNKNALVENISFYLKLFIGIFLALKFNPFYTFESYGTKFTNLDKKIVFSAGMYILVINGIELYNKHLDEKSKKGLTDQLKYANSLTNPVKNIFTNNSKSDD